MKESLSVFTDPTSWMFIISISLGLTGLAMFFWGRDIKKYKSFRDNISNGTDVFATTLHKGVEGKVTKVEDEWVTIETRVRRHNLYPVSKK